MALLQNVETLESQSMCPKHEDKHRSKGVNVLACGRQTSQLVSS